MIFQYTWQQVLDGSKTQTRRPVKAGEYEIRKLWDSDGRRTFNGDIVSIVTRPNVSKPPRCKWQVGNTYAVQPGRGQKAVARFLLTGIRREPVNAITEEDAVAEGFASVAEFAATWDEIHGAGSFDSGVEVWVLEFQLVEIHPLYHSGNIVTNSGEVLKATIIPR